LEVIVTRPQFDGKGIGISLVYLEKCFLIFSEIFPVLDAIQYLIAIDNDIKVFLVGNEKLIGIESDLE
jgi:hypothetical protein